MWVEVRLKHESEIGHQVETTRDIAVKLQPVATHIR